MFDCPPMRNLIEALNLNRVWTWMRCFGHPMPKPTVLFGNVAYMKMRQLYRPWSKQLEEADRRIARADNMACGWIRRSLLREVCIFRTARKFWARRRQVLRKIIYTFRTISKTGKMQVTGGKDLASSSAYTRAFARALLATFQAAKEEHGCIVFPHYKKLWSRMEFQSKPFRPRVRNVEEDSRGSKTFNPYLFAPSFCYASCRMTKLNFRA